MTPLLLVIVTFGLVFVVTASLAMGFSTTTSSLRKELGVHSRLDVMLLISNFVAMAALLIGLASVIHFNPQVKMAIIVLGITAGAPFIPWLVSKGMGGLLCRRLLRPARCHLPRGSVRATTTAAVAEHGGVAVRVEVAWPLLLFILLPLLIGMICRARYPEFVAEVGPWLGPISITFLVVHISLYIGYSWSEFLSLAGGGQIAFTLVFPLAGLLIGYLLSPPYVLSPIPAANPHHATKIVSLFPSPNRTRAWSSVARSSL